MRLCDVPEPLVCDVLLLISGVGCELPWLLGTGGNDGGAAADAVAGVGIVGAGDYGCIVSSSTSITVVSVVSGNGGSCGVSGSRRCC